MDIQREAIVHPAEYDHGMKYNTETRFEVTFIPKGLFKFENKAFYIIPVFISAHSRHKEFFPHALDSPEWTEEQIRASVHWILRALNRDATLKSAPKKNEMLRINPHQVQIISGYCCLRGRDIISLNKKKKYIYI